MGQPMTRRHLLNRDEIHTIESFSEFLFHAVPIDCKKKASFLGLREGFDSISVTVSGPVFDFKKDSNSVFFGDDIDLSSLGSDKIGFDNFILVLLEVLYSEQFRTITGFTR